MKLVKENLDFQRHKDPIDAMGLGKTVYVKGDRGLGIYTVRLIEPYNGADITEDEEVWKVKDLDNGDISYAVRYSYGDRKEGDLMIWGGIDPFIGV